jgi:predicted secreted Zn-dependent protease
MDRLRPRGADGKRYAAIASARLRWDYTYQTTSDECRIGTALVLLDIHYQLPRWTGQASAPRALGDAWEAYLEKVLAHEREHGEYARKAAGELETALLRMPARRYCDEVGKAVNDLAREVEQELRRNDDEYDKRTMHGFTEGAIFPP